MGGYPAGLEYSPARLREYSTLVMARRAAIDGESVPESNRRGDRQSRSSLKRHGAHSAEP